MKKWALIVYDFDGVMTDNCAYLDETGCESVRVNRSDGLAIGLIRHAGISQLILSTEKNLVVKKRAEKLALPVLYGIENKRHALEHYCKQHGVALSETAYIGNDINDLEAMRCCAGRVCPADAVDAVKAIATIQLKKKGGEGCVREFYDLLFYEENR